MLMKTQSLGIIIQRSTTRRGLPALPRVTLQNVPRVAWARRPPRCCDWCERLIPPSPCIFSSLLMYRLNRE